MSNTSCATYLDNAVIAIANIVLIQSTSYIRPNISGNLNPTWENGSADYTNGAFSRLTWDGNNEAAYGPGAGGRYYSFNASSSNAIYDGEIIQPASAYSLIIIKQ